MNTREILVKERDALARALNKGDYIAIVSTSAHPTKRPRLIDAKFTEAEVIAAAKAGTLCEPWERIEHLFRLEEIPFNWSWANQN